MNINSILSKGENLTTEFKSSFNNEVIETLVAFANSKGGSVYIGLPDKGEIIGVDLNKESLTQWQNEIKNKTAPNLIPDFEVLIVENKSIVHRDYRSSSDSIVKVFDTKIEFYNPGRLPDNISVDDLINNTYKSTPRNKLIAEFFKRLGLIEKYGSGIRRIINYFKEEGLPAPEFRNISDGFMVTVFSKDENVTDKVTEKVTENQMKIIKLVAKNASITSLEIASALTISDRKTKENIKKLKNLGIIIRIGPDKGGYWKIVKEIDTL